MIENIQKFFQFLDLTFNKIGYYHFKNENVFKSNILSTIFEKLKSFYPSNKEIGKETLNDKKLTEFDVYLKKNSYLNL